MARIFISREINPRGPFGSLSKLGHQIFGHSLIRITYLPFELPSEFDWIFFYSQHGVRAFFHQFPADSLQHVKIGAFGPKTAGAIFEHMQVQFIGNGKGDEAAAGLDIIASHQTVLFARATNSMRSVQKHLVSARPLDLEVYDNVADPTSTIPPHDIAVLTSPLNAKTYFSKMGNKLPADLVAIGQSTATTLYQLGASQVMIPDNPSEESIVTLLLQRGLGRTKEYD